MSYIKKNSEAIIGDKALYGGPAAEHSFTLRYRKLNYRGVLPEYCGTRVGAAVNGAGNMLDNQQAISQQIYSLKQSVSGVNSGRGVDPGDPVSVRLPGQRPHDQHAG
jgi:hypothetical protein